jgi:AraC-like DNA-binding protein
MPKPKLIVYSQELPNCPSFETIFNTEFNTELVGTSKQFLNKIGKFSPDAVVVCFCSAQEKDSSELQRLDALAGPIPVISCSKNPTPDFVRMAVQQNVNRFLCCNWGKTKRDGIILEAIHHGGIEELIEVCHPGSLTFSSHVPKIINAVIHAFPRRLHERELAGQLKISQQWLRTLCRQAFAITFSHLIRRIWIHQALRLMKHTSLDNTEIALQLNYSEESSMTRDFHKELGYNSNEARKHLANYTPEELLKWKNSVLT